MSLWGTRDWFFSPEPLVVSLMQRITPGFFPFLFRDIAASWVSTFSQFFAISSALAEVRLQPSSRSFLFMYVLLHLQSISTRL